MDYVYICENNTIYGTKYKKLPNTKGKNLVADVASCFLSETVDVSNGRLRPIMILFTIHHHATASISVARYSNGSRRWAVFQL